MLEDKHPHARLKDFWEEVVSFCERNPIARITTSTATSGGIRVPIPSISIANRLHQNTASAGYVKEAVSNVIANYGNRQKRMANTGKEYKGLYHSIRLIYEANDILDYGTLTFPFSDSRLKVLRDIKNGNVSQEYVFNLVDDEVAKLEIKSIGVVQNKKDVQHKISKILFSLRGRNEVRNVMGKYGKTNQAHRTT